MKRLATLLLAAGLACAVSPAQAVEFRATGEWLMGFNAAEGSLVSHKRLNGKRTKSHNKDIFSAGQRLRLQLDAIASETLSGTVFFEIGDTVWGQNSTGGALGADSTNIIKLKRAYLDWAVPGTELKVRMGVQGLPLPFAAGGSAIHNDDVAGVVVNWQFHEHAGVTLTWARPYNDNYTAIDGDTSPNNRSNYLDNMDLIALAVPITYDGIEVTPWIMYGTIGQNTFRNNTNVRRWFTMSGYEPDSGRWSTTSSTFDRERATSSAFWAGLPVKLTLWEPWNIEFDINYGYVQSMGRGWMETASGDMKRYDTRREGWLAKAIVEYQMDWGTPGILGWYSSGDDGNPGNGSERLPTVSAAGCFTSFLGDGNLAWASSTDLYDRNLSYAGTWGIGLQIRDMSFVDDLKHTFRAVYWGGTNSPAMAKYAQNPWGWGSSVDEAGHGDLEHYLTTNDGILEFNLVNALQVYENLQINLELGYLVNFLDHDTWKKSRGGMLGNTWSKQDAWKAQLIFAYTF